MSYKELLKYSYEKGNKNCYWLCKEVYKTKLGIDLPEYNEPEELSLIEQLIEDGKELVEELAKPEPFCFVLFSLKHPYVTHIGIVLEDCKTFIHLLKDRNVAIEKLDSDFWKRRNRGFYKWKTK